MRKKLFQYAVIWHPTEKQNEDGQDSKIVVDLTTILATDEKAAVLLVARQIPEEYLGKAEQLEIALRPFSAAYQLPSFTSSNSGTLTVKNHNTNGGFVGMGYSQPEWWNGILDPATNQPLAATYTTVSDVLNSR